MQDKYRRPYGWGVAEYSTLEELFGYDFITSAYHRDPQKSRERMMQHLASILPDASVILAIFTAPRLFFLPAFK